MGMRENTCCFIGHRTINETEELKNELTELTERLIAEKGVDTFLFGSKSRFDGLCLETVTVLKEKYPHVRRIYVRAEFPEISEDYEAYLLAFYEDTYYPEKLTGAGKAAYVRRNREMVDGSKYCVFYYDESCVPTARKSGTKLALDYAAKQGKEIFVLKSK